MELKNNINDSKQLISIIQSRYPKMSKGQKLIAQYIIKNYDKVAFMTASKLGETVGVSESTVVRFANALGYSGYPKLQDALQELIKNKLTTVQRVQMSNEDYSDDATILSKVLKSDIDNIKGTLEEIDPKAFKDASEEILKARKIYVLGMRSAFSFPRYSKKSYQVVDYAKSKGAHVISITDSYFAPVACLSDNTLLVKSNMASFVDSLVPAMTVANALAISVGMKEKSEITKYFNDLEKIWKDYAIYE